MSAEELRSTDAVLDFRAAMLAHARKIGTPLCASCLSADVARVTVYLRHAFRPVVLCLACEHWHYEEDAPRRGA